ncbi:hypothetical protein IHV12_17675 [Fictibacillus sp. 7GRE50]|uniref:hypothetical protein n=1 Tax=Fictibacillus sp. 7GRE50 TaxID=2745878 RepID=UPI0018CDDAEA|nr:hypothetical protein [Fictibacillus sp. 7GRE50]MBH0166754.1 hypothetical protein [Fictibacillus sp. 7GRE50]
MIALVKIYKRTVQKDGYTIEAAGAKPYGIYDGRKLEVLNEDELYTIFPNTGKIFITDFYQPPLKEVFRFHELIESNTFDISRPTSCKYLLGKEIINYKLFEVIDLDETIEKDRYQIEDLLSKGLSIPFVISNQVIFRTADDYLLGPVQMEFTNGIYRCKEENYIPYYEQEIDITAIFDKNQERYFCINQLDSLNLKGWIDVANEQRVISDALKQLKDNAEFAELSRKMIARLKEWYNSDNVQGTHIQERLYRAIKIMKGHTLKDEEISVFTELILELDITKSIIDKRVKELFENEYNKFLKANAKLEKENNKKKQELEKLKNAYVNESKVLENLKSNITEIEKIMHDKIERLRNNFASVYAEQLAISNIPNYSMATFSSVNSTQLSYAQFQSNLGKSLMSVSDFKELLNNNLAIFKGNDENGTLAATISTAVILHEPIIIFGESSFELSKCIAKTISSEQMLTVIPEIETFSLTQLNHEYARFTRNEAVKTLIIHNPHTTAALYTLPVHFKQNKWIEELIIPDLVFITIDSIEEANALIEKMPHAPIINSMDYMSRFMTRHNFNSLQPGQLMLEKVNESVVVENSISIRRDFREWIEDNEGIDVNVPNQLIGWLNYLQFFISEEELFEWCYKVFKNSLKLNQNNEVGVEA